MTTAAERAKPSRRVGEIADQGLRPADFLLRRIRVALLSKRHCVRKGVVADPVALVMGADRKPPTLRLGELLADDEERGLDAVVAKRVEHAGRHRRFRAVVKSQGQIEHGALHQFAGCNAPDAGSSAAPWPPRVPVRQIAALFSIHRSAALKAIAIASTSKTPAKTCGLSRTVR